MALFQSEIRISYMALATGNTVTLELPIAKEDFKKAMNQINPHDGDVEICDVDSEFKASILQNSSLEELNMLAEKWQETADDEKEDFLIKFEFTYEQYPSNGVIAALEEMEDSNVYIFKDCDDRASIGYDVFNFLDVAGSLEVPDLFLRFFDYDAYAEDMECNGDLHDLGGGTWVLDLTC